MYFIGAIMRKQRHLKDDLINKCHSANMLQFQLRGEGEPADDSEQTASTRKQSGSVYQMSEIKAIKGIWHHEQPYHPEDCDTRYLHESLVDRLTKQLDDQTSKGRAILELIQAHEQIHRKCVVGEISKQKEINRVEKLYQGFYKQSKSWPHQEKLYHRFYYELNNGNW